MAREEWTYADGLRAFGVAALIVIGAARVHGLRPHSGDFFRTLVPVLGLIGAGAAIAKLSWRSPDGPPFPRWIDLMAGRTLTDREDP